jgi:acyl carrier protein
MDRKDIFAKVQEVVAGETTVKAADVGEKSHLKDDLGLDSLDVVGLIEALQDEFGVAISDEEAQELDTIGKMVDLLAAKLG